jgi:hypothetical protein
MSAAALPSIMPQIGLPWFKGVFGSYEWPKAARRLWEWLRSPEHHGADQIKIKDKHLARILGVGRRCIQAGLWYLEHVAKVIVRWHQHATSDRDGGRVIEIIIKQAGPKPKAQKPARIQAKTTATPAQIPNVGPIPKATPDQQAAAAAAIAAAAQVEDDEPTPEQQAALDAWLEQFRRKNLEARNAARPVAKRLTPEQVEAQLEQIKARRLGEPEPPPGAPQAPSGP